MRQVAHHRAEQAFLLIALGSPGLLGSIALVAGAFIAPLFVPDHDWIADTISDLAAGRWEIIMDVALYGFAAGLFAVALAGSHAHLGAGGWSVGVVSLAVLVALVIVIAAHNEYGDGDSEGVVIHIYLVYGLGVFFLLMPSTMAAGMARDHPGARQALIALGVLWAVASPVFFFLPTSVDGIYERALGLVACAMVAVLSLVFIERGRACLA